MKLAKIVIAVIGAAVALGMSSCSKKVVTTAQALNSEEIKVEKKESQKLAEQKPATRASGEATSFRESFARQYAEAAARAEFARKLGAEIQSADKQSGNAGQIADSDGQNSNLRTDEGFLSDASIEQIAKGQINNTAVIHTDTFKQRDGKYHVYVCVEYMGSIADLAKSMADSYRKSQGGQQLSDEERAKLEVRAKEFEEHVEKRLSQLNGGSTF